MFYAFSTPHEYDVLRTLGNYSMETANQNAHLTAFDEGNFANDPIKAAEEVIYTLSTLDDVHPIVSAEQHPLRFALQSCWARFRQRASPSLQYRWKRHLTLYCVGVLQQVGVQHKASRPTVAEYMDMRAGCVGAYPCIGLME